MSTEIQEMPEQGEIILATITKVMDHGAYVTLDEYDDIQGFLHISEIAPGWIRSVNRFVKDGEKKVLLVKKIKAGDIDLSLKQVSKDQKKQKLKEVKKYEKGKTLLENLKEKVKLSDEEIEKLEDKFYTKFDSVYDGFMEIARNGISVITDLKLTKKITTAIEEICLKIKVPSVEIRGIMEITNNSSDGVEIIKKILLDTIKKESTMDITYLGAPKYRISITAEDFKSAEKSLKPILEEIQTNIEKKKGLFKFTREESKKSREN
ncbi:MAG: S1 RNA-binding domain-containing protein [Candidatus Nitrosopumilus limneticus]|nr:Eukaryotic translation initiation factor 2 alpha subunit [Candidatus Nitrosopumilus limneticus]MSS85633.1 S1 RNA-binding domain-containing protein [Nitrosopumilus sp.]PHY04239.1 MAG: RNA-binding protein [Nitrososphaerota archaeon]MDC4211913.1 S1 RNA-binding domain-containing protein [Candidatus Nitrosopumilus limneticus]MDC4213774.1 S1 RNA-binding domain-containing protein [Candidatus Nitrosopumilus limneticus]